MTESVVLPISGSMERVSTDEHRKPRSKKCAWWHTRQTAVLRPSMIEYAPIAVSCFDVQSSNPAAGLGGVAA